MGHFIGRFLRVALRKWVYHYSTNQYADFSSIFDAALPVNGPAFDFYLMAQRGEISYEPPFIGLLKLRPLRPTSQPLLFMFGVNRRLQDLGAGGWS